ncbi:hypothetical protein WG66_011749 [Moniliophthora roreri]|nr:hypothetical protein WG66_011749 [Moniliophthora roreri]
MPSLPLEFAVGGNAVSSTFDFTRRRTVVSSDFVDSYSLPISGLGGRTIVAVRRGAEAHSIPMEVTVGILLDPTVDVTFGCDLYYECERCGLLDVLPMYGASAPAPLLPSRIAFGQAIIKLLLMCKDWRAMITITQELWTYNLYFTRLLMLQPASIRGGGPPSWAQQHLKSHPDYKSTDPVIKQRTQLPLLEDDDNDEESVRSTQQQFLPMELNTLFNFTSSFSVDKWEKNVRSGLEDEMSVFEWLNIDTKGEDDFDPDAEYTVF